MVEGDTTVISPCDPLVLNLDQYPAKLKEADDDQSVETEVSGSAIEQRMKDLQNNIDPEEKHSIKEVIGILPKVMHRGDPTSLASLVLTGANSEGQVCEMLCYTSSPVLRRGNSTYSKYEFLEFDGMVEWVAAPVDPIEISLEDVAVSPTAMVRTFSAHNVFERMPKWETEANSKELCALVAHVLVTQAPTSSCIVMVDKKFLVFDPGGPLAFFNNGSKLRSSEIEARDAIFDRIWQWDPGGLLP